MHGEEILVGQKMREQGGMKKKKTGRREKEKRDKKDGDRQKRESRKQTLRMVVAGNAW
jgi:hypothetical protein